jgi:hypothetical protein
MQTDCLLFAFFIIGFENGIQFSVLNEAKETVADPTESLLGPLFSFRLERRVFDCKMSVKMVEFPHKYRRVRIWWNWQTHYFEVVVGQPVQVQVLLCAPKFQFPP